MNRTFSRTAIAGALTLILTSPAFAQGMGSGPHGSGPHGAQMKDADGDQRMSPRVERFMRLYDLNGDGKVTVEEINDDQGRLFGAMDIDNDKSLSEDEMRRRGRSLQVWRTVTMFDLMDVNGDGKLSIAEIQDPTKRWFKRYDANKNGVLEADEIPSRRWGRDRGRR